MDYNDEEVVKIDQSEWKRVLVYITTQHTETKPDYIHIKFLRVTREERDIFYILKINVLVLYNIK